MAEGKSHISHLRVPGFPCPECKQPIVVEAMSLLAAHSISCASCGLELILNREDSTDALEALDTYVDEFKQIEGQLPIATKEQPTERGRRRPRPSRLRESPSRSRERKRSR